MDKKRRIRLTSLEGQRVSVALADGSRIDDCQLVSAARPTVGSIWLVTGHVDRFVPADEVVDVWQSPSS